ncbi:hypothetical protein LRS04_01350 [Phenylobacterium sp. J367]|nr:hypothetical protein [Phenylobacterium sp. J367]MCR5877168.1 hypothetical protein [Phenylobacterium sp. J367]
MAEIREELAAASCAPPVRLSSAPRFITTGRVRAAWARFAAPTALISSAPRPVTG